MPQIVLQVPPEVIQLLGAIRSSLQRIEADIRDCRARLGYPVVHAAAPAPGAPPKRAAEPASAPPGPRRLPPDAPRSVTPAGPKAAARVSNLMARLDLNCRALAEKVGVTDQALRNILNQASGISVRMDKALANLEASRG